MQKSNRERASKGPTLIIFARFPQLGKVKTRLSKDSSPEFGLELYSSMLFDTLERIKIFRNPKIVFFDGCSQEQARDYLTDHSFIESFSTRQQAGNDLGQRMWNACKEWEAISNGLVFLGTDSPSLPLSLIEEAFSLVSDDKIALGPAYDGGYYLLGIPACRQDLFVNIPWGTDKVLEYTIHKLESSEYRLLSQWYDIDSMEDVRRLGEDLRFHFQGYPHRTANILKLNGLR